MSIQSNSRCLLLMPALVVWLCACALPPSAPGKPVSGKKLATADTLAELTDAETMGCVCKPHAEKWTLTALALQGTTGYTVNLGEFSNLGACMAAKKRRGRICQ